MRTRPTTRLFLVTCALAAVASTAGCSRSAPSAAPEASGGKQQLATESSAAASSVKLQDGSTVQLTMTDVLPPEFPDDLRLPEGTIVGVNVDDHNDEGRDITVKFETTTGPPSKVLSELSAQLTKTTWTKQELENGPAPSGVSRLQMSDERTNRDLYVDAWSAASGATVVLYRLEQYK